MLKHHKHNATECMEICNCVAEAECNVYVKDKKTSTNRLSPHVI